jgi:glutamyl-tRNA synthetase
VDLPVDTKPRLLAAIPLVKDGAKTIVELGDLCQFVLKQRPITLDEKSRSLLTEETRGLLARLMVWLTKEEQWTPEALLESLRAFAKAEGVGLGKFGAALRAVLSGGASAPDLASALSALGSNESLGRLEDALSQVR